MMCSPGRASALHRPPVGRSAPRPSQPRHPALRQSGRQALLATASRHRPASQPPHEPSGFRYLRDWGTIEQQQCGRIASQGQGERRERGVGGCWAVGLVGCAAVYGPVVLFGWPWIAGLYLTQKTSPALYVYVYKFEIYLIFS